MIFDFAVSAGLVIFLILIVLFVVLGFVPLGLWEKSMLSLL